MEYEVQTGKIRQGRERRKLKSKWRQAQCIKEKILQRYERIVKVTDLNGEKYEDPLDRGGSN